MPTEGAGGVDPKIEAEGLKVYEQVGAFERLRTWRLPLGYVVFVLIPVLNGAGMWWIGHTLTAVATLVAAMIFALLSWFHWSRLKAQYEKNLARLTELEKTHGDALPWVQVEKHFEALEQLKRELAEEREKEGI
ncbi:MAG: hypothetical protein LV479_09070 [Methylacidiphilales bacterium]|nr:hypothetical protein [Candidatus Methylacidiphilales bacterium]